MTDEGKMDNLHKDERVHSLIASMYYARCLQEVFNRASRDDEVGECLEGLMAVTASLLGAMPEDRANKALDDLRVSSGNARMQQQARAEAAPRPN